MSLGVTEGTVPGEEDGEKECAKDFHSEGLFVGHCSSLQHRVPQGIDWKGKVAIIPLKLD